jgi:hypothetical protein
MESPNGDKYTGEWNSDGEMTEGTMEYASGDVYTGQFQDGLRHSQSGVFCSVLYLDDKSSYRGQWFQGLRHTGVDGNGNAQNGQVIYKNGAIYTGKWTNDTFERSRERKISYFNGMPFDGIKARGFERLQRFATRGDLLGEYYLRTVKRKVHAVVLGVQLKASNHKT